MPLLLDDVQIGRMALANIGQKGRLESLSERTTEAQLINLYYEISLQQLLEPYDWNFARERAVLTQSAEAAPTQEWSYRYVLPADCLRARYLEQLQFNGIDNGLNSANFGNYQSVGAYGAMPSQYYDPDPIPFKIEGGDLLTNCADPTLVYTKTVTDPSIFPPLFAVALSWRIAAFIALPITGKTPIASNAEQSANIWERKAAGVDANESVQDDEREAEIVRTRV